MFKLSGKKKKLIILQMSFQQSWQWYFIGWKFQTWFLSIHPGRMRTDWYSPLFSRDNATHALAHTETIQSQTCKVSEVLNCICWLLMRVFVFSSTGRQELCWTFIGRKEKQWPRKKQTLQLHSLRLLCIASTEKEQQCKQHKRRRKKTRKTFNLGVGTKESVLY